MHKIDFEIETLSPVIISSASNSTVITSTHSEISGSISRGVLAKKYISEKIVFFYTFSKEKVLRTPDFFYAEAKFIFSF